MSEFLRNLVGAVYGVFTPWTESKNVSVDDQVIDDLVVLEMQQPLKSKLWSPRTKFPEGTFMRALEKRHGKPYGVLKAEVDRLQCVERPTDECFGPEYVDFYFGYDERSVGFREQVKEHISRCDWCHNVLMIFVPERTPLIDAPVVDIESNYTPPERLRPSRTWQGLPSYIDELKRTPSKKWQKKWKGFPRRLLRLATKDCAGPDEMHFYFYSGKSSSPMQLQAKQVIGEHVAGCEVCQHMVRACAPKKAPAHASKEHSHAVLPVA